MIELLSRYGVSVKDTDNGSIHDDFTLDFKSVLKDSSYLYQFGRRRTRGLCDEIDAVLIRITNLGDLDEIMENPTSWWEYLFNKNKLNKCFRMFIRPDFNDPSKSEVALDEITSARECAMAGKVLKEWSYNEIKSKYDFVDGDPIYEIILWFSKDETVITKINEIKEIIDEYKEGITNGENT